MHVLEMGLVTWKSFDWREWSLDSVLIWKGVRRDIAEISLKFAFKWKANGRNAFQMIPHSLFRVLYMCELIGMHQESMN